MTYLMILDWHYQKLGKRSGKTLQTFDESYRELKQNRVYHVIQSEHHSTKINILKENELATIIADALLGEPYAVQLGCVHTKESIIMAKRIKPAKTISSLS